MRDISTTADIDLLMRDFYSRLLADDRIGYLFTNVAKIDFEHHIPKIVSFWAQNLLGEGSYSANVMKIHMDLDDKSPLLKEHFDVWLAHLDMAIDAHFAGPVCNIMKTRALSIATFMQVKTAMKNS